MKRLATVAAAAVLIMGSAAYAQDFGNLGQRPERRQHTPEQIAEMRAERDAKSLDLTDEQRKQIYGIYLEEAEVQRKEAEEMRRMMQERREKREAREAALDETMRKILDASQYKKWSKLKQSRNQQMRGRFGGPEGGFGGGRPEGGPDGFGGGFGNGMGF